MDPQTGRMFFGLMMSFLVLLVFSLIFMPPGSPSLPLAEIALVAWIGLFSYIVYDIRKQASSSRTQAIFAFGKRERGFSDLGLEA